MKELWCWRCQMLLPMLEDDEWAVLMEAHRARGTHMESAFAFAVLTREAAVRGLPLPRPAPPDVDGVTREMWYLCAGYEMFTGMEEDVVNTVWHHRASLYGPPCPECGKPLRTPKARLCAACGWGMSES